MTQSPPSSPGPAPNPWPANAPPERLIDWAAWAESDRAAGFEIDPERFERFSQRDDIFNRAWWDEAVMSPDVEAFYNQQIEATTRRADGFDQWGFALKNGSWSLAWDVAARGHGKGIREGFLDPFEPFHDVHPSQAEDLGPEENARRLKKAARLFGADLAGITAYDPRFVYSHRADIATKTREEKPNPLPEGLTSVLVLGHEMDHDLVRAYPSATAGAATGREYSREAAIVTQVASFIRGLGWQAIPSSNDTGLTIPMAVKAGLGEFARNQTVITKEFGPRVRFSKVYTDMPLAQDVPAKLGVTEFCDVCDRCAKACPPRALPFGPRSFETVDRSNIKGVRKWHADNGKCFGYWTKMKTDCAICMRVCPWNRNYRRRRNRLWRWLAGGRLRKLALRLADRQKHGARIKPQEWWDLP